MQNGWWILSNIAKSCILKGTLYPGLNMKTLQSHCNLSQSTRSDLQSIPSSITLRKLSISKTVYFEVVSIEYPSFNDFAYNKRHFISNSTRHALMINFNTVDKAVLKIHVMHNLFLSKPYKCNATLIIIHKYNGKTSKCCTDQFPKSTQGNSLIWRKRKSRFLTNIQYGSTI